MKNFTLNDLYEFRENLISGDYTKADLDIINEIISQKEIVEDVDCGGGAFSSGMGDVFSAQPSTNAGSLSGPSWSSGGGTIGSGDISVPINLSAGKTVSHKIKSTFGRNHGASTGKKSRTKKLDVKAIRSALKNRGKVSKILNFDGFSKSKFDTVTKVKEGRIYRGSKSPHEERDSFSDKIGDFRDKVENLLKSLNVKIERNGNDFEASKNEDILIIMFRDSHISLKGEKEKFPKRFTYNEFGKIKAEIISMFK